MRVYKPQATKPIPADATIDRKKGIVTYKAHGKSRRAVLTDGGRMRIETSIWHIEFRDHLGRKVQGPPKASGKRGGKTLAAFTHEGQSRFLAGRIEQLIAFHGQALPTDVKDYFEKLPSRIIGALQKCGLLESEQTPITKPLSELLGMYEQALKARERSAGHIFHTVQWIKEVFDACGFNLWREVKDQKVEGYLRDLREGERHVGYRRSNAYLIACQSFCNWIVNDRTWARESPLRGLKKLNAKEDPRHTRRAITVEQLRTLLQKTADGPERYGMSGRERYLLYRVAVESGLRRGELTRLRKADFDFDAGTMTVRAEKASKNKRRREQALSVGLCAELKVFLASKLPDAKAFGGWYASLTDKTADMLREDLAEAGIPYADDKGDVFDFHALRGETASLLIDAGVDPKQAQEIMRHSSIGLTMDVYAKIIGGKKKAQAIAALPDLSLSSLRDEEAVKTGTDDRDVTAESLRKVYSQDAQVRENLPEVCFQDGQHRISDPAKPQSQVDPTQGVMEKRQKCVGQLSENKPRTTAFLMQNQRSDRIVVPRVAGSNPVSHPSTLPPRRGAGVRVHSDAPEHGLGESR
jgi:integrase